MMQFSATEFFWCGAALRTISADCLLSSMVAINGQAMLDMGQNMDDKAREKALAMLPPVEASFRKIGLFITADTTHDLIEEIEAGHRNSCEWLHTRARAIEDLAKKELKNKFFLYIPPERAKYWPKQNDADFFGPEVSQCFPSVAFDIRNAGACLAATFSTAAVFHLMRALEVALAALGAKFDVSLQHTNWGPAITEIEKKIRNMHVDPKWKALADCKAQQEFYSQAASHFGVLKDAWRNYTMHIRETKYTEDEAALIFDNVKGFMQNLAKRGITPTTDEVS